MAESNNHKRNPVGKHLKVVKEDAEKRENPHNSESTKRISHELATTSTSSRNFSSFTPCYSIIPIFSLAKVKVFLSSIFLGRFGKHIFVMFKRKQSRVVGGRGRKCRKVSMLLTSSSSSYLFIILMNICEISLRFLCTFRKFYAWHATSKVSLVLAPRRVARVVNADSFNLSSQQRTQSQVK
jgi:hypothetical protein